MHDLVSRFQVEVIMNISIVKSVVQFIFILFTDILNYISLFVGYRTNLFRGGFDEVTIIFVFQQGWEHFEQIYS